MQEKTGEKRSGIISISGDAYIEFVTINGAFSVWLVLPETRTYLGTMRNLVDVEKIVLESGMLEKANA